MRYTHLTASFFAALIIASCGEGPQSGGAGPSPELSSPAATADRRGTDNSTASPIDPSARIGNASLPKRYQGLDPRDITPAEIDELTRLKENQTKSRQAYYEAIQAWAAQSPASRGPEPVWKEKSDVMRIGALSNKLRIAEMRKTNGNYDPKIFSKSEVEELIALEKAHMRQILKDQESLAAKAKSAPAPSAAQPYIYLTPHAGTPTPRLQELRAKVQSARDVSSKLERINGLSETYNIPILDNERAELIQIYTERNKLEAEMSKVFMEAVISADGKVDEEALVKMGGGKGQSVKNAIVEKIPRDILLRMSDLHERLEILEAPFKSAEKRVSIRKRMTNLSETSGVPISTEEIEETIALHAEKTKSKKEYSMTRFENGEMRAAL